MSITLETFKKAIEDNKNYIVLEQMYKNMIELDKKQFWADLCTKIK